MVHTHMAPTFKKKAMKDQLVETWKNQIYFGESMGEEKSDL